MLNNQVTFLKTETFQISIKVTYIKVLQFHVVDVGTFETRKYVLKS